LLIGNFGDGKINAFNPDTGGTSVALNKSDGQPMVIDGLWALKVGNGAPTASPPTSGGASNTLYFTAGPNDESDGLFGALSPH
jgi:uncharacterized protein (TIGR03118 family)